ncbi:hypothetical protein [Paraburkholderia tropica]|uniref:hypothetical protein n=1 Tax=Paraburkholderia tropica TaxID=92647 RepID=UPI001590FEB0|nr:hypothetical protein [Paraburkholderia tropica]
MEFLKIIFPSKYATEREQKERKKGVMPRYARASHQPTFELKNSFRATTVKPLSEQFPRVTFDLGAE